MSPAAETPRLAVIVPLLNEARVLPALLAQAECWPVDRLVFVDGGSTDGTREILAAAGVEWLDAPRGRAAQMNAGAAAVAGSLGGDGVLLFLHADTRLDDAAFAAVRRAMRDPAVVGGRFDVRLSGAHPAFRLIERAINLRSRLTRISTGDQAMFVRGEAFARLGGFPEQPLMEDVELSKRLKRDGRIACLRESVVTSSRRWEQAGVMRTVWLMWRLRWRYWRGESPWRLAEWYREVR